MFIKGGEAAMLCFSDNVMPIIPFLYQRGMLLSVYLNSLTVCPALCTADTLHGLGKLEVVPCLTLSSLQWMTVLYL